MPHVRIAKDAKDWAGFSAEDKKKERKEWPFPAAPVNMPTDPVFSSIFAVLRTAPPQRGVMGSFFVGLLEVAPIVVSSVEATRRTAAERARRRVSKSRRGSLSKADLASLILTLDI